MKSFIFIKHDMVYQYMTILLDNNNCYTVYILVKCNVESYDIHFFFYNAIIESEIYYNILKEITITA